MHQNVCDLKSQSNFFKILTDSSNNIKITRMYFFIPRLNAKIIIQLVKVQKNTSIMFTNSR